MDLLAYWDSACGPAEPITRVQILGAIWDGAFHETLYRSDIIDDLIWRYDPVRTGAAPPVIDSDLASGGVASEIDFVEGRDAFDAFTMDLADQLLPHVPPESLEAFFCLFYSGRTDAAWTLLRSDALVGTNLRWYYDNELRDLESGHWVPSLALTGSWWRPEETLARLGNHYGVGVAGAVREQGWLFRLNLDLKLGRSAWPYYVSRGEDDGWSDRFNAVWVSADLGHSLVTIGRHRLEAFAGIGLLNLKPFNESELRLNGVTLTAGAGYRCTLDDRGNWFAGVDGQREWLDDLQTGGTRLDGPSWSARLLLGFSFNQDRNRRLTGLGR